MSLELQTVEAEAATAIAPMSMYASLIQRVPQPTTLPVRDAANDDEAGTDDETSAGGQTAQEAAAIRRVLGLRIVAAREINGIAQVQLANRIGFANSTQVSLWEQGRRAPPLRILPMLAAELGVSSDFLLGLDVEPSRIARDARRNSILRAMRLVVAACTAEVVTAIDSDEAVAGPGGAETLRELMCAASVVIRQYRDAGGALDWESTSHAKDRAMRKRLGDAVDTLEDTLIITREKLAKNDARIACTMQRVADIAAGKLVALGDDYGVEVSEA